MTGVLLELGVGGLRLALLVLGHVIADFVVQTDEQARRKTEPAYLLGHGVVVLAAHLVVFLPYMSAAALAVLVAVAVVHVIIDGAKVAVRGRYGAHAPLLVVDQALHGATILAAWTALRTPTLEAVPLAFPGIASALAPWTAEATIGTVLGTALIMNHVAGSVFVRALLQPFPSMSANDDGRDGIDAEEHAMGRVIGQLERFVALVLVLVGQWGALGLVIAAKSIARFRDLQHRPFAEYYLIGTLASLSVAITIGVAVTWLVL